MRTLLIGLSLASILMTPALAAESERISVVQSSPDEWPKTTLFDFGIDISVPSRPAEPVLQYAVIRFYILPHDPMLRPSYLVKTNSEHPEFDPRLMPPSHFRIKAFRDEMHERYGDLNYWV